MAGLSLSPATPPPPTEEGEQDMKERLQNMIDLQYEYTEGLRDNQTANAPHTLIPPPVGAGTPTISQQQQQQQQQQVTSQQAADVAAAASQTELSASQEAPQPDVIRTLQSQQEMKISFPPPPSTTKPEETLVMQGVHRGQLLGPTEQQQLLLQYPPPPVAPPPSEHGMSQNSVGHNGIREEILQEQIQMEVLDMVPPRQYEEEKDIPCNRCCCLWNPFIKCCCGICHSEIFHKSVCFGAMDGMLTGAGIVATFYGMGGIITFTAYHLWVVVAFCFAACTSDALCMAVGHVRSTLFAAEQAAEDRRSSRELLERNRVLAKAKLVDMLLSRGMLKIDAMSVVDTLVGYPDLFLTAMTDHGNVLPPVPSNLEQQRHEGGGMQYGSMQRASPFRPPLDPEDLAVSHATRTSMTEAVFMMLSFSIAGSIPAFVFLFMSKLCSKDGGDVIDVGTASTLAASVLMALLGVWKSNFLDAHWMVFAVETVVVLWICVGSAYCLGYGLATALSTNSPVHML